MEVNTISKNILLGAAVVTMLNFHSCKKYEDGPAFSLRTKKSRLKGEWEVVEIIDNNGQKITGVDVEMEFEKDGDFSTTFTYSYYGTTYTSKYDGEWEFSSDKEELEVTVNGQREVWEIKRLTNKEFWFEDEDGWEWELEAE